jgi:hypothetical protein
MREKINEDLIIENQLLSNQNLKMREAYLELLQEYLNSVATKCPENLLESGRRFWIEKIS